MSELSIHEPRLLVRASDPISSIEAAERAVLFSGPHRARILSALKARGTATAHELAESTGLTVVQVDRRLPELQREGLADVVESGDAPLVRDGYRVWRAKQQNVEGKSNA